MRLPFVRSANTHSHWEDNEWSRNNGYQSPIDNYLLLQWIAGLTVDVGFFAFLHWFVNGQPPSSGTQTLIAAWNSATPDRLVNDNAILYWPYAWQIMAGFSAGVKVLSIITSFVATEDPIITTQRDRVPRSKTYSRRYGIPVVDPTSGVCGICRIKVPKSTRHCKLCNKCVAGMDHHCRWLNCCIGQSNYRLFMTLVSFSLFALIWYAVLSTTILLSSIYRKNVFASQAFERYFSSTLFVPGSEEADRAISRAYYLCVAATAFLTLLSSIGAAAMMRLCLFHVRLAYLNMTTVEFINRPGARHLTTTAYQDEDEDEDYDFDDFDDYYDDNFDDEYEEEEDMDDWRKLWSPAAKSLSSSASISSHYLTKAWRVVRRTTYRLKRPWRRRLFCLPRRFRYRRVDSTNSNRDNKCCGCCSCCTAEAQGQRISTRRRRRQHNKLSSRRRQQQQDLQQHKHDDLYMEELLATQTIRPLLVIGEEEEDQGGSGGGPNYEDDMGLDMSILDEKYATPSPSSSKRGSKAARILDISDEQAIRYQESHQAQRIQDLLLNKNDDNDDV